MESEGGRVHLAVDDAWGRVFAHTRVDRQRRAWRNAQSRVRGFQWVEWGLHHLDTDKDVDEHRYGYIRRLVRVSALGGSREVRGSNLCCNVAEVRRLTVDSRHDRADSRYLTLGLCQDADVDVRRVSRQRALGWGCHICPS